MSFEYSINENLIPGLRDLADDARLGQARHLVSDPINDWGQNALSVAIALKADDLVRQMLDCLVPEDMRALFECVDEGYWTALDHAAIRPDANYYRRLKELIGDRSYKEPMATSASFLRKTAELSRKPLSEKKFTFNILDGSNALQTVTNAAALQKIPFADKPARLDYFSYATPEVLFEMWNHMAGMAIHYKPYVMNNAEDLAGYSEFVERVLKTGTIPEIAFKVITHDDAENPVDVGVGIVALQDIPAGKIVMEYGGRCLQEDESHNNSFYRYEFMQGSFCMEGKDIRTPGATLNHSFPNVKVVKIVLPGRIVLALKTLVPILKGQEVRHTYGHDNFAYCEKRIELAPRAAGMFLKRYPPSELVLALGQSKPSLEQEHIIQGWSYFLYDSGVYFLKQLMRGKISAIQALFLLEKFTESKENLSTMHPLERWRWCKLGEAFFRQIPLAVYIQALHSVWYSPEESVARSRQLRGHFIPFNFRFT